MRIFLRLAWAAASALVYLARLRPTSLRFHHPNARCAPAVQASLRPALDKIARDLKAQIILRMPGAETSR